MTKADATTEVVRRPSPGGLLVEPLVIGSAPQFLFDHYVVDNTWGLKIKSEAVQRVFHAPQKHAANPLIREHGPSFMWVIRDADAGLLRMYYQINVPAKRPAADDAHETLPDDRGKAKGRAFRTQIAYAQSRDGVHWDRPSLDLYPCPGVEPNNVVLGRSGLKDYEACAPCILEGLPEDTRRGYRYLLLYRAKGGVGAALNGIRLVGSQDGIHWDAELYTFRAACERAGPSAE